MRVAILDLGTNTFNLTIAEKNKSSAMHIIYSGKLPVKLGQGGINQGEIIPVAYHRGINAINMHSKTIIEYEVDNIKAFGTSALRTATNGANFLKKANEILGVEIEVISGDREAELIYYGVRQTYDMSTGKYLILDIGGGSNEFIIANDKTIYWKKSYKLGIARLLDMFKPSDPITPEQIMQIEEYIKTETADLPAKIKEHKVTQLLGASGSFETFKAMIYAEKDYISESALEPKALNLSLTDFNTLYQKLVQSTLEERKIMPGLEPMRVEMIVLAAVFVKFITQLLGIESIIQTNFALKEGAAFELLISESQ